MTSTVSDDGTERQSSPPTRRVVQVMSLLVEHADSGLTLADIVRSTGIPRGTAHAVATQLCDLGWLTRRPDNSFALGLSFLSTSRRVAQIDIVAAAAGPALQALAAATRTPAFLARRDDDAVTVTDHASSTSTVARPPTGPMPLRRLPLRPPLCREFVAWADDSAREAWLNRSPDDQRPRLIAALDAIRDRGYSIERITDDHRAIIDALNGLAEAPSGLRSRMADLVSELSAIDYLPHELTGEVGAVSVGAPIFDADGAVVAALVSRPDRTMTATDLTALGRTVARFAARASTELGASTAL